MINNKKFSNIFKLYQLGCNSFYSDYELWNLFDRILINNLTVTVWQNNSLIHEFAPKIRQIICNIAIYVYRFNSKGSY